MDNKRLFLVMGLMVVLAIGWKLAVVQILKRHPDWAAPTVTDNDTVAPTIQASSQPTTAAAVAAGTSAPVPSTGPVAGNPPSAGSGSVVGGVLVVGSPQAISSKLGSEIPLDKEFPLQLDISPQGAGLDSVTLNDFWETAEHKNLYVYQKPFPEQESLTRPLATRWITINGQQLDVSNINWARTACDQTSVTYVAHVTDSGITALSRSRSARILSIRALNRSPFTKPSTAHRRRHATTTARKIGSSSPVMMTATNMSSTGTSPWVRSPGTRRKKIWLPSNLIRFCGLARPARTSRH
jgi:hypothetical protein